MGSIVVDTSAIIAIAFEEPDAPACRRALGNATEALISAANVAESLVVGLGKGDQRVVESILSLAAPTVIEIDAIACRRMAEAYARWGKGIHPAHLNIFDCFAYALAAERRFPLLYIGNDFAKTDIQSALSVPT